MVTNLQRTVHAMMLVLQVCSLLNKAYKGSEEAENTVSAVCSDKLVTQVVTGVAQADYGEWGVPCPPRFTPFSDPVSPLCCTGDCPPAHELLNHTRICSRAVNQTSEYELCSQLVSQSPFQIASGSNAVAGASNALETVLRTEQSSSESEAELEAVKQMQLQQHCVRLAPISQPLMRISVSGDLNSSSMARFRCFHTTCDL